MKNKIVKVDNGVSGWELKMLLIEKGIEVGQRFSLSIKTGRRRKLKSARVLRWIKEDCEVCGSYEGVEIKIGKNVHSIDSHHFNYFLSVK